jgi:hypothetical protein
MFFRHYLNTLVLPTNTTCTEAHAAVAAKISTGRALVVIAKVEANSSENAMMTMIRIRSLEMKKRAKIAIDG